MKIKALNYLGKNKIGITKKVEVSNLDANQS